jgi:hypothetical protein
VNRATPEPSDELAHHAGPSEGRYYLIESREAERKLAEARKKKRKKSVDKISFDLHT